jgi:2-C-methyl-D-erythritol 4-phosphate cytidylyltransferase
VTDDAGLVEALGVPVLVIPGAPEAFKVTHPDDLDRAERLLARLLAAPVSRGGAG